MSDGFDLLLRGGEVMDGTGAARFRADVGVAGDRITAIGDLASATAAEQIDATGRIVAPGFVDVHNHTDAWLLKTPHLEAKTTQGFTTEVIAADGISYAPVDRFTREHWVHYLRALNALTAEEDLGWQSLREYMEAVDGRNVQNAMTHLPYANVRALACGWGRQAVDDFQMRQIQRDIADAMEGGAVGVSTGLDYIVQCFSTTDELVEACSAMAPYDGLYVTHVRYKKGLLPALREAVEIGRRAGVRVHISHLKADSPQRTEEVMELLDQASREVDLSFDVYPYQPGSTMLSYLLPYEVWEEGPLRALDRLGTPEMRERFARGLEAYRLDLDHVLLAWTGSGRHRQHYGATLNEFIRLAGKPAADVLYELLVSERLAVLCVMDEGDDKLVIPFLKHELYMMGSDGIYHEDGAVHPRVYGSAGRLLGRCVREWKLFSLEEAVHKLSGKAAARFGIDGRGEIREAAFADLVVFDERTVADRATFADPHQTTVGIDDVIVNGRPIRRAGAACPMGDSQPLPGRYLPYRPS